MSDSAKHPRPGKGKKIKRLRSLFLVTASCFRQNCSCEKHCQRTRCCSRIFRSALLEARKGCGERLLAVGCGRRTVPSTFPTGSGYQPVRSESDDVASLCLEYPIRFSRRPACADHGRRVSRHGATEVARCAERANESLRLCVRRLDLRRSGLGRISSPGDCQGR